MSFGFRFLSGDAANLRGLWKWVTAGVSYDPATQTATTDGDLVVQGTVTANALTLTSSCSVLDTAVIPSTVATDVQALPAYITDTTTYVFEPDSGGTIDSSQTINTADETHSWVNGTYEFSASSAYNDSGNPYESANYSEFAVAGKVWISAGRYPSGNYNSTVFTTANGVDYYGEYLHYKLPYLLKLTRYQIRGRYTIRAARLFYILASLDGTTWDLLDTRELDDTYQTTNVYTFEVSNTSYYQYFRLVVNKTMGNDYLETWFYLAGDVALPATAAVLGSSLGSQFYTLCLASSDMTTATLQYGDWTDGSQVTVRRTDASTGFTVELTGGFTSLLLSDNTDAGTSHEFATERAVCLLIVGTVAYELWRA